VTETRAAGDVDYERSGRGYAVRRRTEPRIAAHVHAALGSARTVLNVGAGAGSYEPEGRYVLAVEPSPAMRAQRPPHLAPAIDAVAEALPFDDASVDAGMATFTVHQWADTAKGLAELRRVVRGPIVILTADPSALDRWWLAEYAPELVEVERRRYPPLDLIRSALASDVDVRAVPVPADCVDGFAEAYYARPEELLEPEVRRSQSAWGFVDGDAERRSVEALERDLASGEWDRRHGAWRTQPELEGSLRLVVARPAT
jgi:SAM-dependent methyltransferase